MLSIIIFSVVIASAGAPVIYKLVNKHTDDNLKTPTAPAVAIA